MMNIAKCIKRMTLGFVLASVPLIGGCGDNTLTWTEEVKLLDGRVITVTQKRRYEEGAPSEVWLTLKLPELGNHEIVWHENLEPLVINIDAGKLYIVGVPHSTGQLHQYGNPKPPYIGFQHDNDLWKRLTFNEIPIAIYDSNMWIEIAPENGSKHISLADKERLMKDERYMPTYKRIDPKYVYLY